MPFILIVLSTVLVLTTVRATKVKSFKIHILIDGLIVLLMFLVVVYRKFAVGLFICLLSLMLWIVIGTLVRKYYLQFDFWFTNKLCKIFKRPEYKTLAELKEDQNHSNRFSMELYYYAVEAGLCVLILFIG